MNKKTVFAFVDAINRQDMPMITELMAEDFYFVDTYGDKENKEHMKTGWQGYFDWFPDYFIDVHDYLENDEFAIITGQASASFQDRKERTWSIPACWKVIVKDEQIKLWQVFCDSKKQLDSMK